MLLIFDMDGTIVDSRSAVREAYKRAGVKMPEDAWGQPWDSWLPGLFDGDVERAREAHEEKNRRYYNTARELCRPLPALELMKLFGGWVVTSASWDAVEAVKEALGHDFFCSSQNVEMSCEAKVRHVVRTAEERGRVLYVDDETDVGFAAMDASPSVQFLQVTEHDGVFHLYENPGRDPNGERRVQRWTLSSWLLGATID